MTQIGSKNHRAKLKEEDVKEIKKRLQEVPINEPLAQDYGVSRATIARIRRGDNWRHVNAS